MPTTPQLKQYAFERNRFALAALALALAAAGCASSSDLLVDRMGVSDAKYNRDLADCKNSASFISLSMSNPVATCMTAKGYKVLMGKGTL